METIVDRKGPRGATESALPDARTARFVPHHSVEAAKWADIIAVEGNPLDNIRLLEDVKFVIKAGTVYKSPVK